MPPQYEYDEADYQAFKARRNSETGKTVEQELQDYKQQHPLPHTAPNPRQERITGSQHPRHVGLPEGLFEVGAEASGGLAGGMRGAQLGSRFGPYGAFAGGIIGAGVGVAGARGTIQEAKHLLGQRGPISVDEAIAESRRAFLEGAGGEVGFRLLQGVPYLARAARQRLLAGAISPEQRAVFDQAAQYGIHLTPGSLTEDKAPKLVESTLRRTLAGGGKFEARNILNEQKLQTAVDDWADLTFGNYTDPIKQGELLQKALTDQVIPEHQRMVGLLYKNIDDQTGNAAIVQTTELYSLLKGIRDRLASRGDTHKASVSALDEVLTNISKEGPVTGLSVRRTEQPVISTFPKKSTVKIKEKVTQPSLESVERGKKPYDKGFVTPEEKQLLGIKTRTSYQDIQTGEKLTHLKVTEKSLAERQPIPLNMRDAQLNRHIIGSEVGKGGPPLPDNEKRQLKRAYALMTQAMADGALDFSKRTGKDINLSWALADTMARRGKELYNESIVKKLVEIDPEKVVQKTFQKDALTAARDLTRALDNHPEALNLYRRAVVAKLIEESINKPTERVVGADFAKNARKRGELLLKETFAENYRNFKQFLEIAERMPKESQAGVLWFEQGVYITGLSGAGAAIGAMASGVPGAFIGAVGPPSGWFLATNRLASILTDPVKTQKLLQAYRMGTRAKAFGRMMSQLGAQEIGEMGGPPQDSPRQPRLGLMTTVGQGQLFK